jgi:hypothetical protein
MGKPLNKRNFGEGAGNQIRVRGKIGTNAEDYGFIVRQKGTKRFIVNIDGNVGLCKLVDKENDTLAANEMTIAAQTDTGAIIRATKITAKKFVSSGTIYIWNFDPSISDGRVQIEEVENIVAPFITITAQPVNVIAVVDDDPTFSVTATVTQSGTLTYLWEVSTDDGVTWAAATGGIYSGGTTDTLSLTDVQLANDGNKYRVTVGATGATSVISNVVSLTVTE